MQLSSTPPTAMAATVSSVAEQGDLQLAFSRGATLSGPDDLGIQTARCEAPHGRL